MTKLITVLLLSVVTTLLACNAGASDSKPFTGDLASVFPQEVSVDGTTYRRLELGPLKPASVKKYLKNLGDDNEHQVKVLDALYVSQKEGAEGVMVAQYASAEAAKKAMSEMDNEAIHKGMAMWTRANLLFRASNPAFKSQMK